MKGTELNFKKVRSVKIGEWGKLTSYQKKSYWELHKEYPERHLLDHLVNKLGLDDKKVIQESKETNNAMMRDRRVKEKEVNDISSIIYHDEDSIIEKRISESVEKASANFKAIIESLKDDLRKEEGMKRDFQEKVLVHEVTIEKLGRIIDNHEHDRKNNIKSIQNLNTTITELKDNIKRLELEIREDRKEINDNKETMEKLRKMRMKRRSNLLN
jgi:chromosome segregation ATPase